MFETIRFRMKLRKLEKEKRTIDASYAADIRKAEADKKPREKIADIKRDADFEGRLARDAILILQTKFLIEQANRRLLPVSWDRKDEAVWTENGFGEPYMTVEALSELRTAIRKEDRESAEQWLRWLPGITGILGTLIGLATLVLKAGS